MRRARIQVFVWLGVVIATVAASLLATIPLAVQYHCGRARRCLHSRDNKQALQQLRTALRLAPDDAEIHFLLARTHRRLGNLEQIPAFLRRAKQLGGDPSRAERETWMAWAQAGRLREAEPHLADLLTDLRDDGADVCEAYVQGYFSNLRVNEALQLLDAWQRDYPDDAQSYFMRGYLMQTLTRWSEAADAYLRGLELSPDRTLMRCRLAESLAEMNQITEADTHFRRCMEESPESPEVLTAWAKCLSMRGDTAEARQLLEQVLATTPDDFEALRQLGEIELSGGEFERACKHLNLAADQRPYDSTTRNALGKSLRALGRSEEAKAHFAYVANAEESLARLERQLRVVVERPGDTELRYDIGKILLDYGSPEDGAKWLWTVLEIDPEHEGAHRALAAYFGSRHEWKKAAPHREKTRIERSSDFPNDGQQERPSDPSHDQTRKPATEQK